jgi:acylphosphatase
MLKQVHVYYSGRVQGVGFRFTAERIANDLGLSGWVKNLPSGKVELLAEGEEKTLKQLLEKIDSYFSNYIIDKQISWLPASGEFAGFEIKFW